MFLIFRVGFLEELQGFRDIFIRWLLLGLVLPFGSGDVERGWNRVGGRLEDFCNVGQCTVSSHRTVIAGILLGGIITDKIEHRLVGRLRGLLHARAQTHFFGGRVRPAVGRGLRVQHNCVSLVDDVPLVVDLVEEMVGVRLIIGFLEYFLEFAALLLLVEGLLAGAMLDPADNIEFGLQIGRKIWIVEGQFDGLAVGGLELEFLAVVEDEHELLDDVVLIHLHCRCRIII